MVLKLLFSDELSDQLIQRLSRKVTASSILHDLGVLVLKLPHEESEGAECNKRTIQEAAVAVLHTWRLKRASRQDAFKDLCDALKSNDLNLWAADLCEWASREQDASIVVYINVIIYKRQVIFQTLFSEGFQRLTTFSFGISNFQIRL